MFRQKTGRFIPQRSDESEFDVTFGHAKEDDRRWKLPDNEGEIEYYEGDID